MLVAMDLHYEVGVSARSILASTIELGSGPDGWMMLTCTAYRFFDFHVRCLPSPAVLVQWIERIR